MTEVYIGAGVLVFGAALLLALGAFLGWTAGRAAGAAASVRCTRLTRQVEALKTEVVQRNAELDSALLLLSVLDCPVQRQDLQ